LEVESDGYASTNTNLGCTRLHELQRVPEASRVRVFMLVPSLEIPHLCSQCDDAPCVPSCPVKALSISKTTGAVLVDQQKCIACGACIDACPGRVPVMHPKDGYALICDLCDGDPECAKACQEGRYNALWTVKKPASPSYKLYAKTPDKVTKELAYRLYGDIAEGLL
jgi:carbon-monoxide dehydrogenase iron sulfur subunit